MEFGIHYLMSCSSEQSPIQRYRDTVDQAVHAEALGFESVWPVEQHFFSPLSVLPSPLLLLAAIGERTRTLRLGTAVVLLPLSHPVRVAEEIAVLDNLSNGRVELGVGRGTDPTHFSGFGVAPSESRDRLLEGLEIIHQAWSQECFSFKGRFFNVESLSVVPRPVQRPHPRIRVAANSVETLEQMGRLGHAVFLAAHINPFPKLSKLLPLYRQARHAAGHPDRADDVTLLLPLYVGEDRAQIRRDVEPGLKHFLQIIEKKSLAVLDVQRRGAASEADLKGLQGAVEHLRRLSYDTMSESMAVFDTPDACVARLRWLQQELHVGRVICWFNMGGVTPHDRVMRSMELFSTKVMPHFSRDHQ